ncbi:DUF262 domain-containing protein [Idiomarina loihiensis]|uniref:DUF262 domain-containing protein n=1 Tax=Idiomarina loihiensis TaxID=135577 RepID=UPI00384B2ADF
MEIEKLQAKARERTVKTQTIEYDLETIVKKLKSGVIKLNPEYQRKHRWDYDHSSRLIESLILNIPVPFIYISQDIDVDDEVDDEVARYSVIDGQQRLTAVFEYMEDKFELQGLEVLADLNGVKYSGLPPFLIRRLEERTIRCLRIDSTLDGQVKYDIFERLNSGSVMLEPQELRNATCRGPFRKLIKELVSFKPFVDSIALTKTKKEKMEDEELVLRFFAIAYKDGYKEYRGGFKSFLTKKMIEFNSATANEINGMKNLFENVFHGFSNLGIDDPFAKFKIGTGKRMSKFNASVFDAYCVAAVKSGGVTDALHTDLVTLFEEPEFFQATEGSVNDVKKIETRINFALSRI